jgi:hypothetical protein
VTIPIAQQQVSALLRGCLFQRSEPQVGEPLGRAGHQQTPSTTWSLAEPAFATTAVVSLVASRFTEALRAKVDFPSRARAHVDLMRGAKPIERGGVDAVAIALAYHRVAPLVRHEAEPVEVVEERRFELRPAADPIVILDAQQHASTPSASQPPHVDRVHDVTEV